MNDHDVRDLLARAADLAPDRLDRPSAAEQARSRTARRTVGGGLAVALVAGAALLAVPALDDGGQQRLAQDGDTRVSTDRFGLAYVDRLAYVEQAARAALDACLALPGAANPSGLLPDPPIYTITATGTPEQRRAVEQCLRALPNARIKPGPDVPYDIPVALSVEAIGLEPLLVDVTTPLPETEGRAWLVHDLTLTNPSGQPVFVNDFRFAEMLTGVEAEDRRSADAPGRLFIGLGCAYGQTEPGAPVEPACNDDFRGRSLQPGESATFEVRVWRDLAGMQPPETGAVYKAAFPIHTRSTEPYDPGGNESGPEATVRLTYRPGVAGLLGPVSEQFRANRASFLPLPAPGPDGERRFNTARAEGVLGGDPSTGCLWLSAPGETGSTPIVLLHDTAVADFDRTPWVLRDSEQVLATEGDRVVLGGGYGPNGLQGAVPGCPVTGTPFIGQLHQPRG